MKAICVETFGGPEVMRLADVPAPSPGPGQVLVAVKAAGVNPVDTYVRSGTYPPVPALPYTPGWDGAGIVEAVGEGARRFKPGDRVYLAGSASGTYAEKALCDEAQVQPLPEAASFSQGAAIGVPYATAYRALFQRARAVPGEVVFIHGASGGVGTAAIQLAAAAGLTVIGSAGSEEGLALVRSLGARHAVDHRKPGYIEEVNRLAGSQGVPLILEMLANVNLGKDLGILARFGRVVVIGSRGNVEITPRDLMRTDGAVLGMSMSSGNPTAQERASIHAALVAGLANRTLCPVIAQELPLAEAPRAHVEVMEKKARGKIVLLP
jgi:NADPH2:quinone reductase